MSIPPPSDIETGVSNGDVDWLFRGKSKKLNKKHQSERKPSVALERSDAAEKHDAAELNPLLQTQKAPESSAQAKPSASKSTGTSANAPLPPQPPSKTSPKTNPPANGQRSRSSSAPQPPDLGGPLPPQNPKRRGSLNFISMTSGGTAASNPLPEQPLPLQSVSRSNSNKGRSFFSSLSSKFRLPSFSSPATSGQPAFNSLRGSSPTAPLISPKMTPVAGQISSNQELASHINRPPSELAMAINPLKSSRRSSINSSPHASLDKERGGFFKRRTLVADSPPQSSSSTRSNKIANSKRTSEPSRNYSLRRVEFALHELPNDPQQQIPSRRPRKGDVLIPDDIMAPPPRLAQGISTADGSKIGENGENPWSEQEKNVLLQMALKNQQIALAQAETHAMEAHLSAKKLAQQIANYKCNSKVQPTTIEEDEISEGAERIEIDKPLHMHENHFDEPEVTNSQEVSETITPEMVYTRCCHLREILPIPATLKQLKNKSSPLQVLKMLNPKPTLIDVLSFTDFIAITPINTVIFDNVTMTTEMLKHILSGLVHNKHLEKLSLRNVAINETGWLYLCEFLTRNHHVKKLDISQQRVKQVTKQTSFRSAMNWDLFISAIKARNGIEELVLGGCKLSDELFRRLLEDAISISTCRLGVAATEINVQKCEMLADWMSRPDTKCVGIDFAYNDLSQGQLRPLIETLNTKPVNLIFFSLNSTSISSVEEMGELLRGLSNVKTLRFLDLSSLPQLFPGIISKISKVLCSFPNLKRIHFDLNDLSSQSIAAIANILPSSKSLVHVSLLGNRNLDRGSIGALYGAVKNSTIFTLDLDYDLVSDELSQRLALYLMRNLDKSIKPDIDNITGDSEQEDVLFDGSLLMETAEKLLREKDKNPGEVDIKLEKIITNALIERTNAVRIDMHKIIDQLFKKRTQGVLSFEGKENLLRFCLLDSSLEKVVHMFEQKATAFNSTPLSPSPSMNEPDETMKGFTKYGQEQLHESSSALLDAGPILMAKNVRPGQFYHANDADYTLEPHLVVIDANPDGKKVPVDNMTGRPVLMKSVSQTSMHAKEQEEEEGEFHRWGYFMEHRESAENLAESVPSDVQEVPVLSAVPSGSELRDAIISAKGIDSVTDLISKINDKRVSLDNIYSTVSREQERFDDAELQSPHDQFEDAPLASESDAQSIDSLDVDCRDVHPVVDEAYDKLLNEAERVRSNK